MFSNTVYAIGFTLIGAFGAFGFIYWGLIPVDKDQKVKVLSYIIGLGLSLVFLAAGIFYFTRL